MTDIVDRLQFDATRCEIQFSKGVAANISEGIAEITRLRMKQERMWCSSCGSITRNEECDCTRYDGEIGANSKLQQLVNYADSMQEDARILSQENERLQELLRGVGANRYWEARWRDEKAENERLRAAFAWIDTFDPETVAAAEAKFGNIVTDEQKAPHEYVPSLTAAHMGECIHCGHLQDSPIHRHR